MNQKIVDYLIDFEMFGTLPDATVIEMSIVPFVDDYENPPSFDNLIQFGKKIKFNIKGQGRNTMRSSVEWWKNQSQEAKNLLIPAADDVSIQQGLNEALDFFRDTGVNYHKSALWSRGDIDVSIFVDLIRKEFGDEMVLDVFPVGFWKFREVRTAIERDLGRDFTECPLRHGVLSGFVAHNSIHDCAKDILMLMYSRRYAFGLESIPSKEETDPRSLPKNRR